VAAASSGPCIKAFHSGSELSLTPAAEAGERKTRESTMVSQRLLLMDVLLIVLWIILYKPPKAC